MPGPGQGQAGLPTALASMQKQLERHARRILPLYLEAIVKAGAAAVAANLMPPGFRVPVDATLRAVYVNVGTAPTGHALTVLIKRAGTTIATVNVAAGATSGSSVGLSVALAKGDLLTVDISAIGSTVAGSDVLVTIEAY